jgi:hypothetical protein
LSRLVLLVVQAGGFERGGPLQTARERQFAFEHGVTPKEAAGFFEGRNRLRGLRVKACE